MNIAVVGIFVDFMGTIVTTPDEEMDYIESMFRDAIEDFQFAFKRNVPPFELDNSSVDIYVFDFGGLMPGCGGLMASMYRDLVKQIDKRPNTLFILWGALSRPYYQDMIDEMFGEEKTFGNVMFKYGAPGDAEDKDDIFIDIRSWLK